MPRLLLGAAEAEGPQRKMRIHHERHQLCSLQQFQELQELHTRVKEWNIHACCFMLLPP